MEMSTHLEHLDLYRSSSSKIQSSVFYLKHLSKTQNFIKLIYISQSSYGMVINLYGKKKHMWRTTRKMTYSATKMLLAELCWMEKVEGEQNFSPPNIPLWHIGYCNLLLLKNRRHRWSLQNWDCFPFVRDIAMYKRNLLL